MFGSREPRAAWLMCGGRPGAGGADDNEGGGGGGGHRPDEHSHHGHLRPRLRGQDQARHPRPRHLPPQVAPPFSPIPFPPQRFPLPPSLFFPRMARVSHSTLTALLGCVRAIPAQRVEMGHPLDQVTKPRMRAPPHFPQCVVIRLPSAPSDGGTALCWCDTSRGYKVIAPAISALRRSPQHVRSYCTAAKLAVASMRAQCTAMSEPRSVLSAGGVAPTLRGCPPARRWGLGPMAQRKKQLIEEGKLDKHGRPNTETPAEYLRALPDAAAPCAATAPPPRPLLCSSSRHADVPVVRCPAYIVCR